MRRFFFTDRFYRVKDDKLVDAAKIFLSSAFEFSLFAIFLFPLSSCLPIRLSELLPEYTRMEEAPGGKWLRLPLHNVDHLPVLEFSLTEGAEPIRFLLDTGSFASFLAEEHVPKNSPTKVLSASFPGGSIRSVRRIHSSNLFFRGGHIPGEIEFYSHTFPPELRIQGLLGMNAFLGHIVLLELPKRISFWKSEESRPAPGFPEDNLFHLQIRSGQPLAFILRPPGINMEAWVLDTGAKYTAMEWGGAEELQYAEGAETMVFNFGGGRLSARTRIFKPFCPVFVKKMGEATEFCLSELEVFPGGIPPDAISRDFNKGIRGILGRNWLENYRILLDTKRSLIGIVGKETGAGHE
ncbi:hypothetical protein LEP1GSC050_0857 [Leptospira broomii serovar Hurstbridge str. 5399]|uniref:Aspartyl protease n=1 Tax=Leptospira broomii serovar Hurstbridge str. 5399 TaxID=1049789 RepID=T0FFT7_9LEPT|nr:hypothetical protein [Leptospira broomii]EQA46776.1 hypothetical protein LEP1GSC050_0857 [Leptospira broomii serovar Hurstbridge str. 5399]